MLKWFQIIFYPPNPIIGEFYPCTPGFIANFDSIFPFWPSDYFFQDATKTAALHGDCLPKLGPDVYNWVQCLSAVNILKYTQIYNLKDNNIWSVAPAKVFVLSISLFKDLWCVLPFLPARFLVEGSSPNHLPKGPSGPIHCCFFYTARVNDSWLTQQVCDRSKFEG